MGTIISDKQKIAQLQESFPYTTFDDLPIYEQRYLPRWDINQKAYYRTTQIPSLYRTSVKDLSLSGACIYASPHLQTSEKVVLKIFLSPQESFEVQGTVLWKRTLPFQYYCSAGVVFDHLPEDTQGIILAKAFELQTVPSK